jgi:hypothetical protein
MSTLGVAADVNPLIIKIHGTHVARVWQELYYMIDVCRVTKGGHIEHL